MLPLICHFLLCLMIIKYKKILINMIFFSLNYPHDISWPLPHISQMAWLTDDVITWRQRGPTRLITCGKDGSHLPTCSLRGNFKATQNELLIINKILKKEKRKKKKEKEREKKSYHGCMKFFTLSSYKKTSSSPLHSKFQFSSLLQSLRWRKPPWVRLVFLPFVNIQRPLSVFRRVPPVKSRCMAGAPASTVWCRSWRRTGETCRWRLTIRRIWCCTVSSETPWVSDGHRSACHPRRRWRRSLGKK